MSIPAAAILSGVLGMLALPAYVYAGRVLGGIVGALAVFCALTAFLNVWLRGKKGLGWAIPGLVLGALTLAEALGLGLLSA